LPFRFFFFFFFLNIYTGTFIYTFCYYMITSIHDRPVSPPPIYLPHSPYCYHLPSRCYANTTPPCVQCSHLLLSLSWLQTYLQEGCRSMRYHSLPLRIFLIVLFSFATRFFFFFFFFYIFLMLKHKQDIEYRMK